MLAARAGISNRNTFLTLLDLLTADVAVVFFGENSSMWSCSLKCICHFSTQVVI